jgi:hypothetical protein
MKKFSEFESAQKQWYEHPSLKTHNKLQKVTNQLENTLHHLNELYQMEKLSKQSGSLYETHRTPPYSIANITESYQPRSRQPYQYGSALSELRKALYETHRTPT